jgi:hypothetical protein
MVFMKTNPISRIVKTAFIALVANFLGSTLLHAQPYVSTWVSGTGDDSNPCNRTLPCKSFAGAFSKTIACGEIGALDAGVFSGVTITNGITIDGSSGSLASVYSSAMNAVVINVTSGTDAQRTVTLRNLSINGLLGSNYVPGINGIQILAAAEVNIENCVISGFNTNGITIETAANCRVNIKNCIIRNCVGGAVYAHPSSNGVVVNISKCSLNNSLFGFRADNNVKAILDDCVLASNTNNGVVVAASSGANDVSVNRCVINDTGAAGGGVKAVGSLATLRVSDCTIFNNSQGVQLLSNCTAFSANNNRIRGNTTDISTDGTATFQSAGQQ